MFYSIMRTQIDPVYTGYEIKLQCLPFASGERQEVKKRKEGPMIFYEWDLKWYLPRHFELANATSQKVQKAS